MEPAEETTLNTRIRSVFGLQSISHQLTAALAVILFLVSLLILGYSTLRGRDFLLAETHKKADESIGMLADILTIPMWTYDELTIEYTSSVFLENNDINAILIRDTFGKTLANFEKPDLKERGLYRYIDVFYENQHIGSIELWYSLEEYHRSMSQLFLMALAFIVGTGFIVIMMTGFLLNRFLGIPLINLQNRMAELARGEYALTISQGQPLELQKMALSFEKMAADISAREKSLRLAQFSIDNASEAVFWLDTQGYIHYANDAACSLLAAKKDDLYGSHLFDWYDEPVEREWDLSLGTLKVRGTLQREMVVRSRTGERIPVSIVASYLVFDGKEYIFAFCRDISSYKQAVSAVGRERSLLRTVIDNLPDAVYAKDLQGRRTLSNALDLSNRGFSREEEILGKTDFDLLPIDMAAEFILEDQEIIRTGQALYNQERQYRDAYGRERWVRRTKLPLRDEDGNLIGLVGFATDITEQKEINRTLREREELLHTLINAMPDIVTFKDGDGRYLEANQYFLELFGLDNIAYRGLKDAELGDYTPFYRPVFVESHVSDARAWNARALVRYEETVRRPDGKVLIFDITKIPLFNLDGSRRGVVVIGRDITERKQSEFALRESEARNRALLNALPDMIFLCDRSGVFLDYHAAQNDLLFVPPEQFLGKNIRELMPVVAEEALHRFDAVLKYGGIERLEYSLTMRGEIRHFEARIVAMGEERVLSIVRDNTEQKIAEEEIRQRNTEIGLLYEASRQITRSLDLDAIYATFYELISEIMECDGLMISSYKAEEEKFVCEYGQMRGAKETMPDSAPRDLDPSAAGLFSLVLHSGETLLLRNAAEVCALAPGMRLPEDRGREAQSFLLVPLPAEKHLKGIIQLFSFRPDAYTENHRRILEVLASHMAAAIENGLLYHKAQEEIRERERAESALAQERTLLRTLIEHIPDGIFAMDLEGRKTLANRADLDFMGAETEADVLGKTDLEWFGDHPSARQFYEDDMRVISSGEPIINREECSTDPTGRVRWALTTKLPLRDQNGNLIGMVGIGRDLTERKEAEEALRRSEQKYRSLFETMEQGVIYQDVNGLVISANPAAERITGFSEAEMIGHGMDETEHPTIREDGTTLAFEDHPTIISLRTGKAVRGFILGVYHPRREEYRWIVVDTIPQFNPGEEKPVQVYSTITDISALKSAEESLRERLERERLISVLSTRFIEASDEDLDEQINRSLVTLSEALTGTVRIIVVIFSPDFTGVDAFYQWSIPGMSLYRDLTGVSLKKHRDRIRKILAKDVIQLNEQDEPPWQGAQDIWEEMNANAHLGIPLTVERTLIGYLGAFSDDGRKKWDEGIVSLLKVVGEILANALERRQAERALRISEERYRVLFNQMLDGFALHEMAPGDDAAALTPRFLDANPAFERMTGLTHADLFGQPVSAVLSKMEAYWVDVYAEILSGEYPKHFESYSKEYGKYYEMVVYSPQPRQIAVIISDITQRRQAEERIHLVNMELEQHVRERTSQLEAANKELEAFSYSVSHDLRAPLRSIEGFSQALLEDQVNNLDTQGKNYLRRIHAASQTMSHLIEDLLKLSRVTRSEIHRQPVDLKTMTLDILSELRATQPERQVEFIAPEALTIEADPQLMRIVMTNLIGNAWKFTSKHTSARIEIGVLQNEQIPVYYIKDDGAGFDMAYAGKMFGAFQRLHTAADFEGTGIGLAIVQRVIHRHGGKIWAEGVVEEGAVFYFSLE